MEYPQFGLSGRVALVTGAARGLGRAISLALAHAGADVALGLRDQQADSGLADEIRKMGRKALPLQMDMRKMEQISSAVDEAAKHLGRIDILVNNAGIAPENLAENVTEEDFDATLAINLKGTFLCMKYEARAMLDCGHGGAIVNIGSVNSFLGFPTGSAYVTSKHGLIGLTTSVSAELAPQGIRVNLVCPGFIDTPMHRRGRAILGDELYDKGVLPSVHLRRAGRPEEIARSIVFLCSDEASYITGTTLTPDGGFTLTI